MTVQDIIDKLDNHSPIDSALEWDNVGLLVGDKDREVNSIYIALDATDELIEHAIRYASYTSSSYFLGD